MAQSDFPLGNIVLLLSDFPVAPIILKVGMVRFGVSFSRYLGVPENRLLDLLSDQFFLFLVFHDDLYVVSASHIVIFTTLALVIYLVSFDKYDCQPLEQESDLLEGVKWYNAISIQWFEGLYFLYCKFDKLFKMFR